MADASLTPIFERLNGVPQYHPMSADTFADWSMEAGDMVTMSRGEESITSPVSTSRMVWRGQQQITLEAPGSKEREAISKISKRKYGRGGGGMVNNQYIYHEIADTYNNLRTIIMATESGISTMVSNNYRGLSSYIHQSASSITAQLNSYYSGLSSGLQITASSLNFYIQDAYSSLSSRLSITSSSLSHQIKDEYHGLTSYIEQTASGLRELIVQGDGSAVYPSLEDPSGSHTMKEGDIWIETTGIHSWQDLFDADTDWGSEDFSWEEVRGSVTWVWRNGGWEKVIDDRELATMTDFDRTNDHIRMTARALEVLDGQLRATEANFEIRAQQIESTVIDRTNGLDTRITQTTSSIESEVRATQEGLESKITQTASSIRMEVSNNYKGLNSSITQTASSIRLEVNSNYQGLTSFIHQTSSSITQQVENRYNGLKAYVHVTSSSITQEVRDGYNGLSSRIYQNTSSIQLKANRIELEGLVHIDDLTASVISAKLANFSSITSERGGISVYSVGTTSFEQGGVSCYVPHAVTALQIVQNGNTYTLQRKWFSEDSWQDVGTFSRAVTSMNGSWSNGTLTVTPSPQGSPSYTETITMYGSGNGTSSFTVGAAKSPGGSSNSVASTYVYLTENVSAKTVTAKVGSSSSSATTYGSVSTQATYNSVTIDNITRNGATITATASNGNSDTLTLTSRTNCAYGLSRAMVNGNLIYGKLYYNDGGTYKEVTNSNRYWYYTSSNRALQTYYE